MRAPDKKKMKFIRRLKLKSIVVFCALSLAASNSDAAVGCLSSSTTYTYLNPTGGYVGGAVEYYHRYEADRRTTASNFCTTPVSPSTPCYITATRSGYSSSPGTLVNYSTVNNCNVPMDDSAYIGMMMIFLGGIAVFYLRPDLKTQILSIKRHF